MLEFYQERRPPAWGPVMSAWVRQGKVQKPKTIERVKDLHWMSLGGLVSSNTNHVQGYERYNINGYKERNLL